MSATSDLEQVAPLVIAASIVVTVSRSVRKVLFLTFTRFTMHTIITRYANRECVETARASDVDAAIARARTMVMVPMPRKPLAVDAAFKLGFGAMVGLVGGKVTLKVGWIGTSLG